MRVIRFSIYILSLLLFFSCTRTKTEYYPDGSVKSVIHYRNGKEDGLTTYYRADGGRALEVTMKAGKKEGKLTRWYTNGAVEDISYYMNDSLHGSQSIYDMQGSQTVYIEYSNGKKNGAYKSWHSREMIKEEGHFKNDMFDGHWDYYDKRGVLVGEADFVEGSGTQTAYDATGNIMRTTSYSKNLKNGKEIYYAPSGNIIKTITYKDDRIISVDSTDIE